MSSSNDSRPFGQDYTPKHRLVKMIDGRLCAGSVHDLPDGKGKQFITERFAIALFNVGGNFYAVKDACPHAGYPLSKSVLRGHIVACSSHNWQFDVVTGKCIRGEEGQAPDIRTFPVTIENNEIWITL